MILFSNWIIGQNMMPNFPFDSATNKISYSEVIKIDSTIDKDELYKRARAWFSKTYNSSKDVIQFENKDDCKIIGKALFKVSFKTIIGSNYPGGYINYTISIYTKNGKYKYEITDFYHTGIITESGRVPDGGACEQLINENRGFMGNSYKKTYLLFLIQLDENIRLLVDSLTKEMNKPSIKDDKDW